MPQKRSVRSHALGNLAVKFTPASDQSLLISFGDEITKQAHLQIRKLLLLLEEEPIAGISNVHPAYCSVLVKFDALTLRHEKLEAILRKYVARLEKIRLPAPREVTIPVCYGGKYGADLAEVSALHGLTPERVIQLHSSRAYTVYFLGFVPGFAYLGELPEELVAPRLPNPRRTVPRGSVGIAGNQTGVYPFATPGGWRLLGRTPVSIFQPESEALSLLTIGDQVRFAPISAEEYVVMERA